MGPLKWLEYVGKTLLALVASVLLYRPWRRAKAAGRLSKARRILLVRIDNRVGEALLTTPLLDSLKARPGAPEVHVLVHHRAARVLTGHPRADQVRGLDRRLLFLGPWAPGIRALRRERYDAVINCSSWSAPSITGGLVSRLIASAGALVGFDVWPVNYLQDVNVPPRADTQSEVRQRVHLLSVLPHHREERRLSFRRPRPGPAVEQWIDAHLRGPYAVVNPGGRLGWRRVPPEVFAAAGRTLLQAGLLPVVTWGPAEEPLAQQVVADCPGALLAPPTDLDDLAALIGAGQATVCNNTGPMHLSVALGTPTFALFLRMPLDRWGHDYDHHQMVDLTPSFEAGADVSAYVGAKLGQWLSRSPTRVSG